MKNDASLRDIVNKIITVAGTNCCMFAKAMKQICECDIKFFNFTSEIYTRISEHGKHHIHKFAS